MGSSCGSVGRAVASDTIHSYNPILSNPCWKVNGRHGSKESSAPTILQPRGQIPSTTSTLYIVQITYLSFELKCEMNLNKQKEAGIGPYFVLMIMLDVATNLASTELFS